MMLFADIGLVVQLLTTARHIHTVQESDRVLFTSIVEPNGVIIATIKTD